jgi:hypothetical protein
MWKTEQVVLEVTLQISNFKVLVSNFGWDTDNSDVFVVFLRPPPAYKCMDTTKVKHDYFLTDPFQFIIQ